MSGTVVIDLEDMARRVQHGYHLTNEESRWLLRDFVGTLKRQRRCLRCGGEGADCGVKCMLCNGSGHTSQPEPHYKVKSKGPTDGIAP